MKNIFNIFSLLFLLFINNPSSISAVNEANWFSKSLDNYQLKNCSFFTRSAIIGDFQSCLNKPAENNETEDTTEDATTETPMQTTTESDVTDADWPLSLCPSTAKVISCFPVILDKDCLLPNEREFFETTKNIFQAMHDYACSEGAAIAEIVKNSTECSMKTEQNVEQRCYSMNTNKYNWIGWKLNYQDGQMCKYLLDLKLCELKSMNTCPPEVVNFLTNYWNEGLSVPKCNLDKAPRGTTKNPWDGFIDNDYNWNADGMQDSNYNPWKGKVIGKRSLKEEDVTTGATVTTTDASSKMIGSNKWMKMGSSFDFKKFMKGNKENKFNDGKKDGGSSGSTSGSDQGSFDWQNFMKF